ncbi:MAG TPA: amidohydrolase family protein [Burkholderiales bacterium]|jgi:aminocarboxymuconate-semialdehyde decarboxylase|nr:amidohydrolase family protein [Burkholderiales bacterium]
MKVIDVHTHMLNDAYLAALKRHGGGYTLGKVVGGQTGVLKDGAPFMTLMPGMFDYELRLKAMDQAGVDIAIVTLTSPNVLWGSAAQSLEAARLMNTDMAAQQQRFPERIRFMCSLPWQHPKPALDELKRACDELGAVGVMQLANVDGLSLTDKRFAPVWKEIDRRGLPVLIHPSAPPGTKYLDLMNYNLIASVGFMFDTSLSVSRMIFDGFLERYPNLKIIAAHGGGALPYLAGRLDICFDTMPACRERISKRPSSYLKKIYYDSVVFQQESLELAIKVGGADKVLYGSDYPHNIGDMKGCLARVDALPSAQRDAVRGGNAMRIFRL